MTNNPIDEKETLRAELSARYPGQNVWDATQLQAEFEVIGFMAPFCAVRHKKTGIKGSVEFNHNPRLYYNFKEA